MTVIDRTRRALPAVLVSLALLLGLCTVAAPGLGLSAGDGGSVSSATVAATVPAGAHGGRRIFDGGPRAWLIPVRHDAGKTPPVVRPAERQEPSLRQP